MSSEKDIIAQTADYLRKWHQREMPAFRVFHNFHHAQLTVDAVEKLVSKEKGKIEKEEIEILAIAAYFQHTGLAVDPIDYHQHSADIAERFLTQKDYPTQKQEKVLQLIIRSKESPTQLREKVYYDATHFYLSSKDFFVKAKLLRIEEEKAQDRKFTEKEWSDHLLQLLLHHNYYTAWAQKKWGKRKLEHIAKQEGQRDKAREKTLKKKTGKNIGRGVDTLYRTAFRNHINLSQIADGKANMMISINAIVLSILITVSGAGISIVENFFSSSIFFSFPVIMLSISSLTALILAVFSARPSITAFKLNKKRDSLSEVNLLYFGNFLQLGKEEFISYLGDLKSDQNRLYDDLGRDLYNLGSVLQKKYRLLSISYNVFAGGLVMSVLSFLLIFLI